MTTIIELAGTMYNTIHGTNRYAFFWLGMLGLPPVVLGRFRDSYLQRGPDGALEICIYTRNGGEASELATEMLRTHPLYVGDYHDAYDQSYVTYVLRPTASMRPTLELVVSKDPEHALPASHYERSQAFIRKMTWEPDDPDVQRVKAAVVCSVTRGRAP